MIEQVPTSDDTKHFLVTRDIGRDRTEVVEFADYGAAQAAYEKAERQARGRSDLDIVLLSADSLETVKSTHSSYFGANLDELLPA